MWVEFLPRHHAESSRARGGRSGSLRLKIWGRSPISTSSSRALEEAVIAIRWSPVLDLTLNRVVALDGACGDHTPELVAESVVRVFAGNRTLALDLVLPAGALWNPSTVEAIAAAVPEGQRERVCLGVAVAEVTEDLDAAAARLEGWRGLGFRLALEGFGRVQGALAVLRRVPVQVVKVDPALVAGLGSDRDAESMALGVVSAAWSLDLVSVAAGVNGAGTLRRVRSLGFDRAQGPAIAWPVGAAASLAG